MILKIETTIRDKFKKLSDACKLVDFCGDWAKLSSKQRIYFYGLIRADIDYAIELEKQEGKT